MKTRRAVIVVKYWLKIVQSNGVKYSKQIHLLMLRELNDNPNHSSWEQGVRNLLLFRNV